MLIEDVQFEVGRYAQVKHVALGVRDATDLVTLRLIEEVDGAHLLAIILAPHMQLLLVVADETANVLVVEDVLDWAATLRVLLVRCHELVAKLKRLWDALPKDGGLGPHQLAQLLFGLPDNGQSIEMSLVPP